MIETVEKLKSMGNEKFGDKKYQEAYELYSQGISIGAGIGCPDALRLIVIKCYTNRAQCNAKLGRREEARRDYEAAIKEYRENDDQALIAKAFFNAGFNYQEMNMHEKAIEFYTKCLTFSPKMCMLVEQKIDSCEKVILSTARKENLIENRSVNEQLLDSTPLSPTSRVDTAMKVFNVNFSDFSDTADGNFPPLHPVVSGLSQMTLLSSPLKSPECSPRTEKSFYDGDGIIFSNSTSLDIEDDRETLDSEFRGAVRPSKSKQRHDIDKLMKQHGTNAELEAGSVWFLLDIQWWDQWQVYVDASSSVNPGDDIALPQPINNWDLTVYSIDENASDEIKLLNTKIHQNYKYSKCSLPLRLGIVENVDFVVLPKDAWSALYTWYGGGPPLPRVAISTQQYNDVNVSEQATGGILESKVSSPSEASSSFNSAELELFPLVPPSISDLMGSSSSFGLDSNRSPGGCVALDDPISHSSENVMEEFVFNDCGKPKRNKNGNIKTGDSCFVCRKYSYSSCMKCSAVHYCGAECQAAHWKYHKTWCGRASEFKMLPLLEFQKKVPIGRRGKVGLFNLGNSCYLNSSLQCLSHIKPLTIHLLTGRFKLEVNKTNFLGTGGVLVEEYASLMQDLWFRHDASIQPVSFKKVLGRLQPDWAGLGQQDAHEVIGFLLDKLHEDLNIVGKKPFVEKKEGDGVNDARIAAEQWKADSARDDSIVRDLLGSLSRSRLTCPDCGKVSVSFDYQTCMTLQIPRSTQRMFRVFFIPWRGTTGDSLPRPIEFAVEVDRLATIFAIKKWILRQLTQKIVHPTVELMLCEYSVELRQVTRLFGGDFDEERVTCIRDGTCLAAFIIPAAVLEQRDGEVVTSLQQRVFLTGAQKVLTVDYPVYFPCAKNLSCWKVRNMVWKHLQNFVKKDSALGKLLVSSNKVERASLDMALAVALPLRMVDLRSGDIQPMSSIHGINTAEQFASCSEMSANTMIGAAIRNLGLTIQGGLGIGANKVLGSVLPVDKHITLSSIIRSGSLCMDWSGAWLDQLDQDQLFCNPDRHESAQQAFGADKVHSRGSTPSRNHNLPSDDKCITLEQCLREYTKEEILEDAEAWYCSQCKDHKNAKKLITLLSAQLPEVLIINLKRFEHRDVSSLVGRPRGGMSFREKIETYVDFPLEGLNVAPFCDDTSADRTLYDLFAVCNHYGRMGFGHYSAVARDWLLDGNLSDVWTSFDDNDVRPCDDADDVKSSAAYILFYRRRP